MSQPMTLLLPRWLVPVVPEGVVHENWAVVIESDRIHALMPAAEAMEKFPNAERIELAEHVLIPGLINMHTHSPMTLFRGYADDLALESWLNEHIWPAESRFLSAEFVAAGAELALLEMLRSGTTCFNENYFYPNVIARVTNDSGIRALIGLPIMDFATPWAASDAEYLTSGLRVVDEWAGDKMIKFALAPHAPYSVNDEQLAAISETAQSRDMKVHIHCLETVGDITDSMERYGMEPLTRLKGHGLLNENLLAVHMTQLTDDDRAELASAGSHVIHCPESNLKLASGFCEVKALLDAGVNVAVGTDGAASNNDLDLLTEARTAALLGKGVSGDPCAINAHQALAMITINGARALGEMDRLGSIEPGKQADFCALDLSGPETQPVHNVISQIIYTCSHAQVSDVWVAGKRLLENHRATVMDETAIIERAQAWQARMQATTTSE